MGDEPTGLNLSLDDLIKKQQLQSTKSTDDRINRPRGQRQGNFHNGARHGGGGGGDFDMVEGGGHGPTRRHDDGGRDRGHHNRPYGSGGGGRGGGDRLAGRLRDPSGHDPRSHVGGPRDGGGGGVRTRQIDYREFQKCYVEPATGVVVYKYRSGQIARITPEGEITLNTHGYHNEVNLASMNDALNCIGIRITAPSGDPRNGEWSISDGKSLTRYFDGVVIPAKGASWRGQQVLEAYNNPNRGAAGAGNPASMAMAANTGMMPGFAPGMMPQAMMMPHAMGMGMGYGGRGGRGGGRGGGQRFTPY